MGDLLNTLFPGNSLAMPFKNNEEYLKAQFNRVKLLLVYYSVAKKEGKFDDYKKIAEKDFSEADFHIKTRLYISKGAFFAGEHLKSTFKLDSLQFFALFVTILVRLDPTYRNKILEIENARKLSYNAILKLYYFVDDICDIEDYYHIYTSFVKKMDSLCFEHDTLDVDKAIFNNVMGNAKIDIKLLGFKVYIPSGSQPLKIRENIAQDMVNVLQNLNCDSSLYYLIHGNDGIGKKTIVKRACDVLNKAIVFIDFKENMKDIPNLLTNVWSAFREALFNKAFICFDNLDYILKSEQVPKSTIESIFDSVSEFAEVIFILFSGDDSSFKDYLGSKNILEITLEDLNSSESYTIWLDKFREYSIDEYYIYELYNKFNFTPLQIENTVCKIANSLKCNNKLEKSLIYSSAYSQISNNLSNKATLIKKKHSWDELIMQPNEKEIIRRACNQIRYKHVVYDTWGMSNRILYGKGLSMLFTGPPGTGKTMAAQVVANELSLEIYKVDLSQIVSKYIGETEKNLNEIFNEARKSNVILLFDETDALFSKRTQVRDAHDKNANIETSYLLQKMEEYDGITIMTTNLVDNIDKAFFRRINYVIHFSFPDVNLRKNIWMKIYPKQTPLSDDVDFDYLARNFEIAGGNIKNVALTSSFMAAAETGMVTMKEIVKALEYELQKQGKIISKSDFKEYAYLL